MVERRAALFRRLDEHLEIGPRRRLTHEIGKAGGPQRNVEIVIPAGGRGGKIGQTLSSLSPSRISFSVGASSPSFATTRATAEEACALE
ncbi:hypothetical protein D3C86_2102160 [compost metagenome]